MKISEQNPQSLINIVCAMRLCEWHPAFDFSINPLDAPEWIPHGSIFWNSFYPYFKMSGAIER